MVGWVTELEHCQWGPQAFQKDGLGRRGRAIAVYVKEWKHCEELPLGNSCEQVKGLWVKMKARTKEGHFSAGVCYGCPTRESLLMRLLASDTANITLISSHPDGGFWPPGGLLGKQYSRLQGIQETSGVYRGHLPGPGIRQTSPKWGATWPATHQCGWAHKMELRLVEAWAVASMSQLSLWSQGAWA